MIGSRTLQAIGKRFGFGAVAHPQSWPISWWQEGRDLAGYQADPMACSAVRAAIDLVTTTLATMPLRHVRRMPDGSDQDVDGGLQALLDHPVRDVMTGPDLVDFLATGLLEHGNAYAFVIRDSAGRAYELHPLPVRAVQPIMTSDGSVYYQISETYFDDPADRVEGEPVATLRAADVLHVRLGAHRHPLQGVSPLEACRAAVAMDAVIKSQSLDFYRNASRPSGVVTTEERLTSDQVVRLKRMFTDATSNRATGSAVILPQGAKVQSLSIPARDAETVALLKLSVLDIARAFRVPPPLLGDLSEASFSNVAELNRHFVSGLRYYTTVMSAAMGRVLRLSSDERIVFDETPALSPPSDKERYEALSKGVLGGILTPNEARRKMGLPPVEGGNDVFLQRQNQPIRQLSASPVYATAPENSDPVEDPADA